MGSSKKQTVGYWYNWAMAFGWCKGPVDALLEFRAGDKTAWAGRLTESGRININKPNLWGGEDSTSGGTGGIVGDMDVMFGEATQAPNDYLINTFGPQQSGRRGKFCTVFRGGRFGAFVANPKPVAAKVERILRDWQDDAPWYPEKARVVMKTGAVYTDDLAFSASDASMDGSHAGLVITGLSASDVIIIDKPAGLTYQAYSQWDSDDSPYADGLPWINAFWVTDDFGTTSYWSGEVVGLIPSERYATAAAAEAAVAGRYVVLSGSTSYKIWIRDTPVYDNRGGLSLRVFKNGLLAMNPAHIIYDSLTHTDMQGEPTGAINDASFRAAADKLYSEGFGLCTEYDSGQETPKQFQQRICDVIGASLSQSRVDGLYYLDLIRGDYDLESLPVIGEDDVVSFSQDPSVITETGNKLSAEWFDPEAKETRTTAPVFAMGNVRSAGRVIAAATKKYPEIPVESLALRVVTRDLKSGAMPLNKFDLGTRATLRGLRPGMNARLQLASEGIGDMVAVIGSVAHGTGAKGEMKIVAVQNVYSMPSTVYVAPQEGLWTPPGTIPTASLHQLAIEAPYVELAASLGSADLGALPADAGYLLTVAARAAVGTSYAIATAAAGETYASHGIGDWCPTAVINEAAGYLGKSFIFVSGELLDRVVVGSWALWDAEIVRVDAINADAGTLDLGRSCGDTVPMKHDSGSRIYFCGDWVGSDQREYVGGDSVNAKLLTRTGSDELALADAVTLTVAMNDRASRPYPPAGVTINDQAYPEQLVLTGDLVVSALHRDRISQADQLVDQSMASIGPEDGTTYVVRNVDAVTETETYYADGITSWPHTVPAGDLVVSNRMEIYSTCDGLESWQRVVVEFSLGRLLLAESGDLITTEDGQPIQME